MWKATRSTRLRAAGVVAVGLALLAGVEVACVPAEPLPPEVPPAPPPSSAPVEFGYPTTGGGRLTSAELRGRFTVLALVATYDLASQAQLKVLGLVLRNHSPRVNVAAIVLGPPENAPLVEAYATGLRLPFPIALADERTVEGRGPFEGLRHVPSIVILDRDGREVFRHVGAMDEKPLHAELARVGARR